MAYREVEMSETRRSREDLNAHGDRSRPHMDGDTVTVLIVEDEALLRLVLANELRDQGYNTVEAANAAEAIDMLEQSDKIRALFADVELPGSMNGLLLARYVNKKWPDVTIVITSGRTDPVADQMPVGTIFLPKPRRMMDMQRAFAAIERAH